MTEETIPAKVRISLGSAMLLGLIEGTMNVELTTLYLLTYHPRKCLANCSFCSQARSSTSRTNTLSRITWPTFFTKDLGVRLKYLDKDLVKRICVQAMNYATMFSEVLGLIQAIRSEIDVPISVACQPLTFQQILRLKEGGIDRVSIPLDASTEQLFNNVKGSTVGGPYTWASHLEALRIAVQVFGSFKVSTHLIVGLGEQDEELLYMVQKLFDMGVYPALFAFTPLPGTNLEKKNQPSIERYRSIQLAHFLITHKKTRFEHLTFDQRGRIRNFNLDEQLFQELVKTGTPFMTSGCPSCNRPFYNERARGPIYNYPRQLSTVDVCEVEATIRSYLNG